MNGWTLQLKQAPSLRLDLRAVNLTTLAAEGERLMIGCGPRLVALAEFFHLAPRTGDDRLVFDADLARCDRVGWQWPGGELVVEGNAGHYAGAGMRSGRIAVRGSAGDLAACEMAGGVLDIGSNVGDFAGAALPGSMDGMRGGLLIVRGNAGARFADRMRRGSALVFGDVGDYAASRLVAGTVAVGGAAGAHVGYGLRRGSLVFAGPVPTLPPTYVPAQGDVGVFWQLLARDLAQHGGPFATLAQRRIAQRWRGDLAAGGQGELILCD